MTSTPEILRVALGIVFNDDKVLLVERAKREGDLTWGFPGGKIDPGEEASHAVVRECLEETGVECNQLTFLGELLHEERGVHISYWKGVAFRGEAKVMEPEKHFPLSGQNRQKLKNFSPHKSLNAFGMSLDLFRRSCKIT